MFGDVATVSILKRPYSCDNDTIEYNNDFCQDAELVQRMRSRTSNLTELDTRVNEDAFDRYAAASLNAGDGEYGSVVIFTVPKCSFESTSFSKVNIPLLHDR